MKASERTTVELLREAAADADTLARYFESDDAKRLLRESAAAYLSRADRLEAMLGVHSPPELPLLLAINAPDDIPTTEGAGKGGTDDGRR